MVLARLFGLDKGVFGVDEPLARYEAEELLHKAFGEEPRLALYALPEFGRNSFISRGDFVDALARIIGYKASYEEPEQRFQDVPLDSRMAGPVDFLWRRGVFARLAATGGLMPDLPLTRGVAADLTMRTVTARAAEKKLGR